MGCKAGVSSLRSGYCWKGCCGVIEVPKNDIIVIGMVRGAGRGGPGGPWWNECSLAENLSERLLCFLWIMHPPRSRGSGYILLISVFLAVPV